jgi:hypothetical protein
MIRITNVPNRGNLSLELFPVIVVCSLAIDENLVTASMEPETVMV